MYVDKMVEFSDSQAVTATAISSNVYDTQSVLTGGTTNPAGISPNTKLDIGGDGNLWLVVQTAIAVTDSGSDATLIVTLESADDAGLTTNATVHIATSTLAFATYSAAGTQVLVAPLPAALYRRYIGVRYTVASGPFTAGAFDAFMTAEPPQVNRAYKSGFTVQ